MSQPTVQELEASLAYWKDKAKRVRHDPSIYGNTQPQICARQIRVLTDSLKKARKLEKAK